MNVLGTPEFNLDGIRFDVVRPEQMTGEDWGNATALLTNAFARGLQRQLGPDRHDEAAELAAVMTRANDFDGFMQSRIDPASDPQFEDQAFAKPRIVRAIDESNESLAGYLYSVDGTSGASQTKRLTKMYAPRFMPVVGGKRYAWQREIAVHPDYTGRGVGHVLGALSLLERKPDQIATAYVYPDYLPAAGLAMETLGFKVTGHVNESLGQDGPTIRRERLAAPVGRTLRHIRMIPGAPQAIAQARSQVRNNKA